MKYSDESKEKTKNFQFCPEKMISPKNKISKYTRRQNQLIILQTESWFVIGQIKRIT